MTGAQLLNTRPGTGRGHWTGTDVRRSQRSHPPGNTDSLITVTIVTVAPRPRVQGTGGRRVGDGTVTVIPCLFPAVNITNIIIYYFLTRRR